MGSKKILNLHPLFYIPNYAPVTDQDEIMIDTLKMEIMSLEISVSPGFWQFGFWGLQFIDEI